MAEPGLRFDIFERVHLETEVQGLENLEELELLPHIDLSSTGQQTILKGYLELTGQYTDVRSQNVSLQHRIPVNISMPSERVLNANDLGVEIDHFDVDLLSNRLLNVTGVLYLRGVESADTRPSQAPVTDTEEQYFVHEAISDVRTDRAETPQFPQLDPWSKHAEQELAIEQQSEAAEAFERNSHMMEETETFETAEVQQVQEAPQEQEETFQTQEEASQTQEAIEETIETESNAYAPELKVAAETDIESEELQQEAPTAREMKIAFASKQSEAETQTEEEVTMERAEEEVPAQKSVSEQAQWKNLFLPKNEEEGNQFKKLRMCIVQKEETLDSIAERYSLNPREIVLYNRLGDQQEVSEGQVIYIPKV